MKQKQQRQAQRKRDLHRKKNPKSLEYLKKKKCGDPRQLKGFRSKLTALDISHYKQTESNEVDEPFRDAYFAANINKITTINRSLEMKQLHEKLGPVSASLPHVLLHKEKIFKTIIDFINDEAHKWILHDAVG